MRKFCLVKSLIFKTEKIRKMPVKGLYGNRGFHVLFRSMIYFALKFKFNTIVRSEMKFNFNSR